MSTTDSRELCCHTCGAPLDPTILGGACSACMWTDIISGEEIEKAAIEDAPQIPGYKIEEEIGHGGMGVVYRARQEEPAREVALKIVAPFSLRAAQAKERFRVEIDTMAAVEHPGLLPLYDTGEDGNGRPWLTMKLAQGGSLTEKIPSYHRDWKRSAELILSLCEAVRFAHERGILHRDLKPANILFDREDNAYVADFGLAKWADNDTDLTLTTHLLGSPAYLAPESASGGSKFATTVSDVYGLGAILYEILVGKPPYHQDHHSQTQILTRVLKDPPAAPRKLVPEIPRDLEVITLKAMAREPEKRYPSAAALANDLRRWLEGRPIAARPVTLLERVHSWARRNPALAALSALFLLSLVTGGVLLWRANQKLTVALDSAEARVDFMARELPALLAPVGRLDLLEPVFEDVSEHYETNTRTDAEAMARHADFLTHWSEIFIPRGQVQEAIDRLELAMEKARKATASPRVALDAARARMSAGVQLTAVLFTARRLDDADGVFQETLKFAERLKLKDLHFQSLTAKLKMRSVHLATAQEKFPLAIERGEEALTLWKGLLPQIKKRHDLPQHQLWLRDIIHTYDALGAARNYWYNSAKEAGLSDLAQFQEDQQRKIMEEGLHFVEGLTKSTPENTLFRHELSRFRLYYNRTAPLPAEERRELLIQADHDLTDLIRKDPSNLDWGHTSTLMAFRIAQISQEAQDPSGQITWLKKTGERFIPLYNSYTKNLHFLRHQFIYGYAVALGLHKRAPHEWPTARFHFETSIKRQLEYLRLSPTTERKNNIHERVDKIRAFIEQHEGAEAANAWLSEIDDQLPPR